MINIDNSIKEYLKDWQDYDVAQFYLGCVLGLFNNDNDTFRAIKHIFWTDNELGNFLFIMLEDMSNKKMLLIDRDKMMFKWNKDYRIDE